jgi:lysozyme
MSHSDLLESVERNEGYRAVPYKDTEGLYTFATGRCLETNPLTGEEWRHLLETNQLSVSISKAGADWLKVRQIDETEMECMRVFADFWPELDEVRREALIEMGYQMGMDRLLGFKKMLAAIRSKNWPVVNAEALDSRWARQTPERAKRTARQLAKGERT